MFSEHFMKQLYPAYETLLTALGSKRREVETAVEAAAARNSSEAEALICLYASMPLSDAASYPVSLFESFARHGVFLWEDGSFAGRIPETLFAAYVLHHRVNNEDLADCRPFFHKKLMNGALAKLFKEPKNDRNVHGNTGNAKYHAEATGQYAPQPDMTEAVLAVNYWCASELTYRSSDERTANPLTLYHTGYGRCGEESTFLVTALRSVGIPARQVYVPLWSHCDDNHAWVEVWCDGKWHFLGACEPEEILDRGWFSHAASRAMMVHSRWFLPCEPDSEITTDIDDPLDRSPNCTAFCGSQGMVRLLNHLPRYARTRVVTVTIRDENGAALAGIPVQFSVMNEAAFGWIADGKTDDSGNFSLGTGQGALLISAGKTGYLRGEFLLPAGEEDTASVTIQLAATANGFNEPEDSSLPQTVLRASCMTIPEMLTLNAPKDAPLNRTVLTPQEQKAGSEKLANAREMHRRKISLLPEHTPETAMFLAEPAGNNFPAEWKEAVLSALPPKDLQDVSAEVLLESCRFTAACLAETHDNPKDIPADILYSYLLNPRVGWEPLRPYRAFLSDILTAEQKELFRSQPRKAWDWIDSQITSLPELEYEALTTSAEGSFACGHASLLSKKLLTVQLLRTVGTPSRLNAIDNSLEFWENGNFHPIEEEKKTGILRLTIQRDWRYGVDWSLSVLTDTRYQPVRLPAEQISPLSAPVLESLTGTPSGQPELILSLPAGQYRLLTANRLPNGNLLAEKQDFRLEDRKELTLAPQIPEASLSSMLSHYDVEDFALSHIKSCQIESGAPASGEPADFMPSAGGKMVGSNPSAGDEPADSTPKFNTSLLSELTGTGKALFLWLEEGKEPTEHILREMWERKSDWNKLRTPVYFILRDPSCLSSPVLRQTLEALPQIRILYDDFDNGNCERLARRMYLEPGQFPLVVVLESSDLSTAAGLSAHTGLPENSGLSTATDLSADTCLPESSGLSGLYGTAGYHVGAAGLLLRILTE